MLSMQFETSSFVADPQLIEALSERGIELDCGDDLNLFRQGDQPEGLYLLHSGEVTITMDNAAGDHLIRMSAQPGSLLGLPAVVGNVAYSLSADASKGARVCFVSRENFSSMMLTEPRLALKVVEVLAAEVRSARSVIAGSEIPVRV